MAPKELNFITGNKNKLLEVQAILGDTVDLKNQSLDLLEIQGTVEEVTIDKCKRAADIVGFLKAPRLCLYTRLTVAGARSSAGGGYMSLLQSDERPPRTVQARLILGNW